MPNASGLQFVDTALPKHESTLASYRSYKDSDSWLCPQIQRLAARYEVGYGGCFCEG